MSIWKKINIDDIKNRVFTALDDNVDFRNHITLGVPASYLDPNVFYIDAPFLKDAPFLSTMVSNPNHIGCHTVGDSEIFFKVDERSDPHPSQKPASHSSRGWRHC